MSLFSDIASTVAGAAGTAIAGPLGGAVGGAVGGALGGALGGSSSPTGASACGPAPSVWDGPDAMLAWAQCNQAAAVSAALAAQPKAPAMTTLRVSGSTGVAKGAVDAANARAEAERKAKAAAALKAITDDLARRKADAQAAAESEQLPEGLSTGAKVGIGAGVALALGAGGWFAWRRMARKGKR